MMEMSYIFIMVVVIRVSKFVRINQLYAQNEYMLLHVSYTSLSWFFKKSTCDVPFVENKSLVNE